MTQEDQVFVANVVVTDLMLEMVASSVITWPASAIVEFNTITKIHKYRELHEGHHFIPMAMEVHDAPKHDMDHFIREHARLFSTINDQEIIYPCFFCIQFCRQCVSIAFQLLEPLL
jgi:hypothetical protein